MRWSWLAVVCLAFAAHAHALVIGVYELSPHMVVDTQKEPRGAVVDFVQEVLVKSGEFPVVEWRVANFARMLRELETGQIDMVFMVARNEQRQKLFRYSSQPFFDTRSAVVVSKSGKLATLTSLEQLRQMRVGHAHGSIVPDYLKAMGVDLYDISGDDYFSRGLKMVELNRLDAYFAPTLSNAQLLFKTYDGADTLSVQALPVEPLGLYVVFAKSMDEKTFARLDALITARIARYRTLLQPYIR